MYRDSTLTALHMLIYTDSILTALHMLMYRDSILTALHMFELPRHSFSVQMTVPPIHTHTVHGFLDHCSPVCNTPEITNEHLTIVNIMYR